MDVWKGRGGCPMRWLRARSSLSAMLKRVRAFAWFLVTFVLLASGFGTPVAEAGYEWLGATHGKFATPGTEGHLSINSGIAINDTSNDVYVADGFDYRVTRFNSEGAFLGAWGWDVIATGPGKAGVNRVEAITIKAKAGKFTLNYLEDTTKELEFNASNKVVEHALNELESIKTGAGTVKEGGEVKVEGGPGDETGSNPYIITYEGALGDRAQANVIPTDINLTGGSPAPSAQLSIVTEGVPALEDCIVAQGDLCRQEGAKGEEGDGEFLLPKTIAVDQNTGNVYVFDADRHKNQVQVFSADGNFISSFDNLGTGEKASIAVDPTGNVYVLDESVIKIFRPEAPGDYEHYVYTGEAHDIPVAGASKIAVDSSGNLYVVVGESRVVRFAPVDLGNLVWESSPGCESQGYAGLLSLAVNPNDGDVFLYAESTKKFYRLSVSSCPSTKKFTQMEVIAPAPEETKTDALAFSPNVGLAGDGLRPLGTFYALYPVPPYTSGLIFGQSPVFPPVVDGESTSNVGEHSATLQAQIDPHGNVTHYVFQYSTEDTKECAASNQCVEAPIGGGNLEASEKDLSVAATIGLMPGTTYHFRIVARSSCNPEIPSEVCEATGEDHVFTTLSPSSGALLPDGRGYELVSPSSKDGGEVFPASPFAANCTECLPGVSDEHFPMQSTADGNSIVYEGDAFAATGDAVNENEYLSTRTAGSGWSLRSSGLSPALESKGSEQGYKGSSPDLLHGIIYQITPALSTDALRAPGGEYYANLYMQSTASPDVFTPLLTSSSVSVIPHRGSGEDLKLTFAGASSDFSHVIFQANDALTPGAPIVSAGESNLYEWVDGTLHLINVLPEGTPEPNAVFGSGRNSGARDPDYDHAISSDGSRVFWTAANGHVYVNENGETLRIPDQNPNPGPFLTATPTGSKVLLGDGDLYDLESEESTDLTDGHGEFDGILGTSEDLSKVYFVDTANLTGEEENAEKAKAHSGADNLYAWNDGTTVFVAELTTADEETHISALALETGDWSISPSDRTAEASSDGRYVVFMAEESLTGYDNTGSNGSCKKTAGMCFEVFEYDSVANRLICVSCNPTGGRPSGSSSLNLIEPGSGGLPQPLSVTTSGRVFFDSLDTLSPQDKNGSVEDVYEFEPGGVGSCVQAEGCIFLISSGMGETDSDFVNATPSGSDVFFTTRSQLVPQDQDDLIDLYDAREPHTSGEQVSFPPNPPAQECTSTPACRVSSSSPPSTLGNSLSTTLSGAGNLMAPIVVPPPPKSKPRPLTKAQLLAKALKVCQRQRTKVRKAKCMSKARKQYGVKKSTKIAAGAVGGKTRTVKK